MNIDVFFSPVDKIDVKKGTAGSYIDSYHKIGKYFFFDNKEHCGEKSL